MEIIQSVSGGKTSAYLHYNYPSAHSLFSLICIEDHKCRPKDKGLIQQVNDKLQKYCSHQPEFIATVEDDLTMRAVLDLEQCSGKEVKWLRGDSFEQIIKNHGGMLPNKFTRYCTTDMKMKPIFEWCFKYTDLPVKMQVGFRYDELERADRFTTAYKFPVMCKNYGQHRQVWNEIEWRVGDFPLIEDKVDHHLVKSFIANLPMTFPEDSNCVGCYWKPFPQLRKNFDTTPNKMNWFKDQEEKYQATFKKEYSMKQISQMGVQQDFFFGAGAGCDAGFCTD
jgi:hypothetical protein